MAQDRTLPLEPGDAEAPATLEGTLEHVVYRGADGAFLIGRLQLPGRAVPVTVKGSLPGVEPGERLRVTGRWVQDPRYGRQFQVESYLPVTPDTAEGLERFLAGGQVDGIGPVFARRLVAHFGDDTLDVLEKHPERLREVPGIGPRRARQVQEAWQRVRGLKDTLIFLQGLGIGPALAGRIHKRYRERTVEQVRTNPYRLAADVPGVGFTTADRIAEALGIARDSPHRLRAGLLYSLVEAAGDGHCYLPEAELLGRAEGLLGVARPGLEPHLLDLAREEVLARDGTPEEPRCWAAADLLDERGAARRTVHLARAGAAALELDVPAALQWAEQRSGIRLTPSQREALAVALVGKVVVITGGPGTGKTTLVRVLLDVWERKGLRVKLAAPTGRASRRLEEATGRRAQTLHRLLEFSPHEGRFQRSESNPLAADVLVVDEASMIDLPLYAALTSALPRGLRLVLVGDVDQLPSVGPGQVLDDLIASGVLPVIRLTEVVRQDEAGLIVRNAHGLLRGQLPRSAEGADGDFYFIPREDPEAALRTVVHLVAERIPSRFGLDPHQDVQVLAPVRKGLCGSEHLSRVLRERLNPPGGEPTPPDSPWIPRAGDRVMQVRNNYDKDVFNGDIGRVDFWDDKARKGSVVFDGERVVEYEGEERYELDPAYAVTIHKSQGSEYPAVVVPLLTQHWRMLQRNLLYTAVTRGRRLVVVVGSPRALERAVSNSEARARWTALSERLRRAAQSGPEGS